MAEESFTLTTIFDAWRQYQEHIASAIAPLTAEQMTLRAAPDMRSIGEIAFHILGCRAGWFTYVLGEADDTLTGAKIKAMAAWDEAEIKAMAAGDEQDRSHWSAAQVVEALGVTWQFMMDRVARWSADDMKTTFEDDWDGVKVQLSRAWILYHVMEHDLHHGGELSLTLGMHGLKSDFPG
jgi:uncharacterized damage-inducible protein DinB